jgi:rSAM/selenodomain-associated transferase 2
MQLLRFILLSFIWLATMAAMVIMAPLGKHALLFSALFCLGHVLMVLMVWLFPAGLTPKMALAGIFALGILARLIFLPYPLANDVFRYVWEGCIQNLGFNPFNDSPLSPALAEIARGDLYAIWRQISHPEFSAAYPPVPMLIFRVLARLTPDPFYYKTVMIIFDIGVMIVLMLMIKRLGAAPSKFLFYAANPLMLVYIAGEGHLDIIQVFFLCLAIYLIIVKKYQAWGFLMLGLAVLSKYFAVISLPFLVNVDNRKKCLAVFIPLLLFIPFMDAGLGIFQSLGVLVANFHYNDSLTVLIRMLFGDLHLAATAGLLLICLAWVYIFVHDQLRGVYLALGCALLFLPTLHPWYLVLLTPLLVFFPSRAWLYLQAAVVFTFPVIAIEYKTGVFQEIHWLKLLEYLPFYGFLIWGLFRDGYLVRDKSFAGSNSISAIIPTLNEADSLKRCLKSLKNRTALKEIIVTDGGSTDGTREIAAKLAARVIESPKGRGFQIEKGVEAATGDVIIIMHADCLAQKGVFRRIIKIFEACPHVVGGAFGMKFEHKGLKTRLVAFLNNVRTILTGISFGDQAQFFRSEVLDAMGGFPSMMLMEDVELSLRLKEVGRLVFLRDGILVSGRRWQDNGFAGNLMTVFHLFTRYLIERRFRKSDVLNQKYYDVYYGRR